MVYRLNAMHEDEMEFCAPVSPARLRKMLRSHRSIRKAANALTLAVSFTCIGVSLLAFGYILLG